MRRKSITDEQRLRPRPGIYEALNAKIKNTPKKEQYKK